VACLPSGSEGSSQPAGSSPVHVGSDEMSRTSGDARVPPVQRLLRPVGPASVVVPVATARYTECDGAPVVYDPASRVFQPLTAVGAAIWARLDGRTVAELLGELAALPGAGPTIRVDALEVVRRLRAVGLAEDADPEQGSRASVAAEPVVPAGAAAATVGLRGRAGNSGDGPVVVLDPGDDEVVTVDPADPPARFISTGEGDEGPLTPLEALRVLVEAAAPGTLDPEGALDLLATLAERVEVVRRLPTQA